MTKKKTTITHTVIKSEMINRDERLRDLEREALINSIHNSLLEEAHLDALSKLPKGKRPDTDRLTALKEFLKSGGKQTHTAYLTWCERNKKPFYKRTEFTKHKRNLSF